MVLVPGIADLRSAIPDLPVWLAGDEPPDVTVRRGPARPPGTLAAPVAKPAGRARPELTRGPLELAETVEELVGRLRELARRDRRLGGDVELCELAVEALSRAHRVRAELR